MSNDSINLNSEEITYVLDVDNRHSPCYVVGVNERNPQSTVQDPLVFSIPGNPFYENKPVLFHPTSFKLENNVLVVSDDLQMDVKLAALGRHFMIPFPGSFLDSNALSRGKIQPGNPYAVLILKFIETLEFLLSDEGIHLTWAGRLPGEILPEALWRRRYDNKGEPLEWKDSDKVALKPTTEFYTPEDAEGMEWFEQLASGDDPRWVKNPYSLQMTIKKEDVEERDFKTDRASVYWEFVPLVEPDFGYDEQTREIFPEKLMFDKDGGIECILKHFFIKDPTIDIQKGFLRLYRGAQEVQKRKVTDSSKPVEETALTQEDFNYVRYAIPPRTLVEIFSVLSTDADLQKCQEYEDPGVEIFSKYNQFFNPCHIFSMRNYGELPPIWNSSFDYVKYSTCTDDNFSNTENIFETRSQCLIRTFKMVTESDMEGGVDDFDQDVYLFPVPARVVRIPASRVHPSILSNCLIPAYVTSSLHVRNIQFKEYGEHFPPEFRKLMIPEIKDAGLTELSLDLNKLKSKRKKVNSVPLNEFLVDALRVDKFETNILNDDIKFSLVDGKATPCQMIQVVRKLFNQDFESEFPKAPEPQKAIYRWIKTERKRNESFSLFPDVYEDGGFKYYENLTVSGNFDANLYEYLDDLLVIHQNHKHVMHVYSLLLLATQMNFGDLFCTIFYGPSEVSKSYICKCVLVEFSIPGTTLEEGSQTNQAMNSGTSYRTGMMVVEDDMGPGTSKVFTANGKEADANANMKQMLTSKKLERTALVIDPKTGERKNIKLTSDHRVTNVGNSNNDGSQISPATKSRIMMIMVQKLPRGLNALSLDLKKEAMYPGPVADKCKMYITRLMRSRQAFTCLIFQGIRSGAIPYNYEHNLLFAKNLHERFKNSLSSVLDDNNLPQSLRMENGQLFPLMQEKMISRIYKAICSGVFRNEVGSVLVPGAKFDLVKMFDEIWKRNLLQFSESDYVEAISFFDQVYSQETSGVILKTIAKRVRDVTSMRKSPLAGISFGETPFNGRFFFEDKKNIQNVPRGPWNSHSNIFFKERKSATLYVRNYNWINLGELFPIPNIQTKDNDRSAILNILAGSIQTYTTRESSAVLIFQFLVQLKELFTKQKTIVETEEQLNQAPQLHETIDYEEIPVLRVVDQIPEESKSQNTSQFVLLSSQWLHEKLKKTHSHKIETKSPACGNFRATATELALEYLSFNCCYPGEYLLPGMTFDKPLLKDGFAVPSVPKTLKLYDIRHAPKEYVKNLSEKGLKPPLFFEQKAQTGERLGYNGGEKWGIPKEVDYFTTYCHIKSIDKMNKRCGVEKDGEFKRDSESITSALQDYVENGGLLINSPAGIENSFNRIRDAARQASGYDKFKNYVQEMIDKEDKAVKNAQANHLLPVSVNNQMMGFSLKRKRENNDDDDDIGFHLPPLKRTSPPSHQNQNQNEEEEEEEEEEKSRTFKENNRNVANVINERKKTSHETVEEAWRRAEQEEEEQRDTWMIPAAPDYEYDEEDVPPEEEIYYDDDDDSATNKRQRSSLIEDEAEVEDDY